MADLAGAAAAAWRTGGTYVAVTGRGWAGAEALVDQALLHVVAAGAATRAAVAAGINLGGRRVAVVVDAVPARAPSADTLVVVVSDAAARAALAAGWAVVQPWDASDVAALLAVAPRPSVLLLRPGAPADGLDGVDVPAAAPVRHWQSGELTVLAGSGAAVGPMVRLGRRLSSRGVDAAVLELAVLTRPEHAGLLDGTHLLVGPGASVAQLDAGEWPSDVLRAVALDGRGEAELVGEVLAQVPAARA